MELSRTIASMAVVLCVVLAAGYAAGESAVPAQAVQPTGQKKVDEREAQRREAMEEHQRRKDDFERACNKPLKSDIDRDLCRAAYRRLQAGP